MASSLRTATHAGSWYTSNGKKLRDELQANLDKVTPLPQLDYQPPMTNAKAIIAPHAGYSYSGPAAAWAYAAIPTDKIKRVFLLGPSHHAHIPGIALSPFKSYDTPLGEIPLDTETIQAFEASGAFCNIRPGVDEDEHSLEMHLPYIRHVFAGRDDLKLVPLIVGHSSKRDNQRMNEILEKYWKDDETFFIISSDFCHWGSRFRHTPYYPEAPNPANPVPPVSPSTENSPRTDRFQLDHRASKLNPATPIWKSILYMDHEGIDILRTPAEEGTPGKWEAYLDRTGNTICGRMPILVLLNMLQHAYKKEAKPQFTFVRYEQSSQCFSLADSSVSYVSGVLLLPQ